MRTYISEAEGVAPVLSRSATVKSVDIQDLKNPYSVATLFWGKTHQDSATGRFFGRSRHDTACERVPNLIVLFVALM